MYYLPTLQKIRNTAVTSYFPLSPTQYTVLQDGKFAALKAVRFIQFAVFADLMDIYLLISTSQFVVFA